MKQLMIWASAALLISCNQEQKQQQQVPAPDVEMSPAGPVNSMLQPLIRALCPYQKQRNVLLGSTLRRLASARLKVRQRHQKMVRCMKASLVKARK